MEKPLNALTGTQRENTRGIETRLRTTDLESAGGPAELQTVIAVAVWGSSVIRQLPEKFGWNDCSTVGGLHRDWKQGLIYTSKGTHDFD